MVNLSDLGRLLLVIGGAIVLLGAAVLLAGRVPWLGRLPGDILIRRGNSTIFIPIVTCLVVSLILTVIINVVLLLLRRH